MKIVDLVKESFETACSKGWWPANELVLADRMLPEKVALMHSELSEALDEVLAGHLVNEIYFEDGVKPAGVPIEMADVLIRVGDYVGARGLLLAVAVGHVLGFDGRAAEQVALQDIVENGKTAFKSMRFDGRIAELHSTLSKVLETWRKGVDTSETFARFTIDVISFCEAEGIPLETATRQKLAFNKTRPFRHGGKKA